ncbi:MAG: PEP-CTERM sorting domain-containing protein [Spirulinaceae cyanobacterium]
MRKPFLTRTFWFTIALSTGAIAALPQPAGAYRLFFGEDLNFHSNDRLSTFPNSTSAQGDFLSHLENVGTAGFDALPAGTSGQVSLDFGQAGVATLQGGGTVKRVTSGTNFGRYAISGHHYWAADASGNDFGIQFSDSVAAFGFHGVDIGDFGGLLKLNLTLANGGSQQVVIPNTSGQGGNTNGSVLYFGLIAESADEVFTGLSFDMNAPGDVDIFAFDDLTIGSLAQVKSDAALASALPPVQAVPEPGMVLAGLAGLGLGRLAQRRKRTR